MAEENEDNTITPDSMQLESGVITENSGEPEEEACDKTIDQEKAKSVVGDEEDSDRLAETITDQIVELNGENDFDVPEEVEKATPTEANDSADGHSTKKPTVVIVGSNHKFNVRSRYMSSKLESCHDFCKFGHKHEAEPKTRKPSLGRISEARPLIRTSSVDLAATTIKKEAKKKDFIRRLSLPGPSAQRDPKPRTSVMSPSKRDLNKSKFKGIQNEIKPTSVSTPKPMSNGGKTEAAGKKTMVRSSTMPNSSSHKIKELKTTKEAGSPRKIEEEKGKEPMINSPRTPLKRSPSMKARLIKNPKAPSRFKIVSDPKEASINGSVDVPEKTLSINEPSTDKKLAKGGSNSTLSKEKSPFTPWGSRFSKRKDSKGSQNRTRVGNHSSSSSYTSASADSTKREPSQPRGDDQRNLGSVKTKLVGSRTNAPRSKSTPRSKPTADRMKLAKNTGTNHSDEKDGSAWKVKFKRGTVVALQMANSAPKKLRFRRARSLGEDHKDEAPRSLKNHEITGNEPHETTQETGRVQLRHQEASEKKDSVDLNDVIEETASQLVKTRKSKVKALVGAFETVMSFRDRKPLVEAGAS